jgi:hypothetical protein
MPELFKGYDEIRGFFVLSDALGKRVGETHLL